MFLRYKYFGKLKKDKPQENEDEMKYDAFFCVRSLLSYFIFKAITVENYDTQYSSVSILGKGAINHDLLLLSTKISSFPGSFRKEIGQIKIG